MRVSLHDDFVRDLVSIGDTSLASRVLKKVFDRSGRFIEKARDDHRYKGIPNAWIRYVSDGLRVIFIKSDGHVILYRAGEHAIEEDLAPPSSSLGTDTTSIEITKAMSIGPGNTKRLETWTQRAAQLRELEPAGSVGRSRLLKNHGERFLYNNLLGRRYLPHKDVFLVSPYLTPSLLRSTDFFGQMLDEQIENGATVWLVTKPPRSAADLREYEQLASRDIQVFFNSSLHAKVYGFVLDRTRLRPDQLQMSNFFAIGSANLTDPGINPLGFMNNSIQYELSYEACSEDCAEIEGFVLHVASIGVDLDSLRANIGSGGAA